MRSEGYPSPARRWRGFTVVELLVVVLLSGLALAAATVYWNQTLAKTEARSAARLAKVFIHKARMNAIFEGVNHFVVIDPGNRRLEIYADSGATVASFDATDERIASTDLNVDVALPTVPATLKNPLDDGEVLSDSWTLPKPDSDARWGDELLGVMLTPTGRLQSAEMTPVTIGTGAIVFSDASNNTSAVGIRGGEGVVRTFEYRNTSWKEL